MSTDGFERYQRQMSLPGIGEQGQLKLAASSVAVIGAGGLGSPALLYLAAAGVGNIHIIDGDTVSVSNLNRQLLYTDEDVGKNKAQRAAKVISKVNPHIKVSGSGVFISDGNAAELIKNHDCLVLCLDSISARKSVNRAAVKTGVPFVEGAVSAFNGSLLTVMPGVTPCYECVFADAPEPAPPVPVLGAAAGVVGGLMALAAVRLLLGEKDASLGQLVYIDLKTYESSIIPAERNPLCPVCSGGL